MVHYIYWFPTTFYVYSYSSKLATSSFEKPNLAASIQALVESKKQKTN